MKNPSKAVRITGGRSTSDFTPPETMRRRRDEFMKKVRPELVTTPFIQQMELEARGNDRSGHVAVSYVAHLAICQVWGGANRLDGVGRFFQGNREIPVQTWAYNLWFGAIRKGDIFDLQDVLPVPRCVVANTKNCVHRDHLGLVEPRTKFFIETHVATRQSIRRYCRDHRPSFNEPKFFEHLFGLPAARIARIITRLEGADDPLDLSSVSPVDKVG